MRILFLTNYFPPHEIGGQGRSCLEVFEGLKARGHSCLVLTSMHGVGNRPETTRDVRRELFLEMDSRPMRHMIAFFTERHSRERHNLQALERIIKAFRPDVIFIWGMWNLPVSLAGLAERMLPGRVAYRFAEYWPTLPSQHEMYWHAAPRNPLTFLPKKLLAQIALRMLAREPRSMDLEYPHVMCVSAGTKQTLLEAGVPVSHARVIHTGLDTEVFERAGTRTEESGDRLTLLYAGRLSAEKGIDTLIRAMATAGKSPDGSAIKLTLAGAGSKVYQEALNGLVRSLDLEDRVHFVGLWPPDEIPGLMASHQVLVVPSVWPEPFARVVLEGMAAGMVVVGTPVGGTAEILRDGENGLLFPPGDSDALAGVLLRLAASPGLRSSLAAAGRTAVKQGFTREIMLGKIEQFLTGAAQSREPQGS